MPDYPITVLTNYSSDRTPWFGPAGLVGLGPSSTLLDHLYNSQLIPTRSFGLYMGTAYEQSNGAVNGSLTLGGYDSGRFDGDVHNFTISPAQPDASHSPFKISVQQMTLTDSSGKKTDLLTSSFDAHITTSQYQLNLPGNVLQSFSGATGATPSNDDLNVFRLPDDFDSKLTITLDSGLDITYDAQWLKNVSNNSPISTGAISDNTTNTTVNLFGTAFLSNVYFIANYESAPPKFHLANALPHAPYVFTQSLCTDTLPVAAPKSNLSSFGTSGLTGAIIGGVVGGLGLAFAIFWLVRKYLQKRMWRQQAKQAMKGKGIDSESTIGGTTVAAGRRGKGSPSTSSEGESERGDGSEMATFGFDFNSHQHQAYANYLNNAMQQGQQPQTQSESSRTYTQFINQVSRENIATSRENLPATTAAHLSQPQPQPQIHDPVSPMSEHSHSHSYPIRQYARSLTQDSFSNSPLTPATGVPLLFSQQAPASSDLQISTSHHIPFAPLQLTHSSTSLGDSTSMFPFGAGRNRSEEERSFRATQEKLRGGGLNVRTEFAPPPGSAGMKIARKAVGKESGNKGGLLKRVFPPPPS